MYFEYLPHKKTLVRLTVETIFTDIPKLVVNFQNNYQEMVSNIHGIINEILKSKVKPTPIIFVLFTTSFTGQLFFHTTRD